jgi:transcription initiation factor TFIIH subunit 4
MRILFVEQSVTQTVMAAWLTSQHVGEHVETVKILSGLHILHEQSQSGGLGWKLNDVFRKSLKVALLGGGTSWTGSCALAPDKHAKDVAFLDAYAQERWESVLHHMVRSKEGAGVASTEAIDTLLYAGLIKREEGDSEQYITPAGFQFLLLEMSSQIWFFILKYLENAEASGTDIVDCLTFLFQLSYLRLGKDYSTSGMTESQGKFLQDLRGIGLVYQRTKKAQRFYPTRLAISLTSNVANAKESTTESEKHGFIVVETNYRVYAYTDSSLHLSLLALFSKMLYRFPNMAAGIITRDSVREALSMGITADQIINYLRSHCHPEMLHKRPTIPPSVTDQIRLWEMERDRFDFAEGVLYSQFLSQKDFELLRDYARDLSVLVWENPQKRYLVVTRNGHEEVRRFWKRHKHDAS